MAKRPKASRIVKLWRGRLVRHIDSIAHLRTLRYTPRQIRDFARRVLEAESQIEVRTPEDIHAFLSGCQYVSDRELHGKAEVWQTPDIFEKIQKGDCEEFAFWGWKMLLTLGVKARWTIGRYKGGTHAWVTLFSEDKVFIFEATSLAQNPYAQFIVPAAEAAAYGPVLSLDQELRVYQHG